MKKVHWLGGAVGLAVLTVGPIWAFAADHLDAPGTTAAPEGDINDVYTWLDGESVVLVMDVVPLATAGSKFGDKVQYVFHTESSAGFGMPGTAKDIICTFNQAQVAQCWIGADEYVTGDATATAGIKSASGKVTLFAGLRDDPFFFNLEGFRTATATVTGAAGSLMFDPAGCPAVPAQVAGAIAGQLRDDPNTPAMDDGKDFFAGANTLTIVLKIDKALLNAGGPIMSVWAGTYATGG